MGISKKIIPIIVLLIFQSCGSSKEKNEAIKEESEKKISKCATVQDCLDKFDFENARVICNENKNNCDRLVIIEAESQYWLNQQDINNARKISLEVYSLNVLSKADKNSFYAEKLNDIITLLVQKAKFDEADIMVTEFPVAEKGDKTLKFRIDALKTIAQGYDDAGMKKQYAKIFKTIGPLEKKYKLEEKELANEAEIKSLESELDQLKSEKGSAEAEVMEIRKSFKWLRSLDEKKAEIKAQEDIVKEKVKEIERIKKKLVKLKK